MGRTGLIEQFHLGGEGFSRRVGGVELTVAHDADAAFGEELDGSAVSRHVGKQVPADGEVED